MIIRAATEQDIPQIMTIRLAVKENQLSDPSSVTYELCLEYLKNRGKGWVCEIDGQLAGFSIVDMQEHNVWALFLNANFEGRGIGQKLLFTLLDWYFSQTKQAIWLGTSPGTRAADFYRKFGWKEIGKHGEQEIKFELSFADWQDLKII